jgi:sugar lactone lactonase YvrE
MNKQNYLLFFLLLPAVVLGQWVNGQAAVYVVGQPDFNSYSAGGGDLHLNFPEKAAIDFAHGKIYIADSQNSRVLRYAYPISSNYPAAERTFGILENSSLTLNTFDSPVSVAVYNGTLWVVDQANRILKFNNAYSDTADSPKADGILGQSAYTTFVDGATDSTFFNPVDICIDDSGNMWVADLWNNRVLKFNDVNNKPKGARSDLVLGQVNFGSNSPALSQSGMNNPNGVCVSGTGNNTKVWVTDSQNNRVLRFDNPTANGKTADGVLGQINFTNNLPGITDSTLFLDGLGFVAADSTGRLYVSDSGNGRIVIFNNAASKTNGASADNVLGQKSFRSDSLNKGNNSFYGSSVYGITVDNTNKSLLVADADNNRVLIFQQGIPLRVEKTTEAPLKYSLSQNYPNPFNPETIINYQLPARNNVSLKVYDLLGREVAELVNGEKSAGVYSVKFNGRNLSSGVYFYRIQAGNFSETKKLLLLK